MCYNIHRLYGVPCIAEVIDFKFVSCDVVGLKYIHIIIIVKLMQ